MKASIRKQIELVHDKVVFCNELGPLILADLKADEGVDSIAYNRVKTAFDNLSTASIALEKLLDETKPSVE